MKDKEIVEEFDKQFSPKGSSGMEGIDKIMTEYTDELRDWLLTTLKAVREETKKELTEQIRRDLQSEMQRVEFDNEQARKKLKQHHE
jgi:hypothetical protein